MIGIVKFFQKRPTDKTIRISRIIFGLLLSLSAYYSLIYTGKEIETTLFFGALVLGDTGIMITKYSIISIGLIPIIMGATNICLLKSKYMRYIQIFFGIILFYISGIIKSTPALGIETLYAVMGILPLLAGITGKCITTKCLRYKEKITKIRI